MSIKVNDFRWEKGKNDLEYIALLEKNRDVMLNNFRKCSKVAREQYNKGKADGIAEANLAHNIECGDCVRQITASDKARIRAEAIDEFVESISESVLWDILAEVMKRNIGASEGADKSIDYLREIAEKLKLKEQKNE